MRTKVIILSLYLLSIQFSSAQNGDINKLINNQNIAWIGEIEVDYSFTKHIPFNEKNKTEYLGIVLKKEETKTYNQPYLLKYYDSNAPQNALSGSYYYALDEYIKKIIPLVIANKVIAYSDKSCTTPLTSKQINDQLFSKDTIMPGFNPKTGEPFDSTIVISQISSDFINVFRVHQYIYFDKKKLQIISKPISIAPLYIPKDESFTEFNKYPPLFWLPLKDQKEKTNLKKSNITWAVAVNRAIDIKSANFLKKDIEIDSTFQLLFNAIKKDKIEISIERNTTESMVHTPTWITPISKDSIEILGYDPDTYELKKLKVSSWPTYYSPENVIHIDCYHEFAWDDKNLTFLFRHIGFFPIYKYDEDSIYIRARPIFFRHKNMK